MEILAASFVSSSMFWRMCFSETGVVPGCVPGCCTAPVLAHPHAGGGLMMPSGISWLVLSSILGKSPPKFKVASQLNRFVLIADCLLMVKQMVVVVQTVAMPDR